MYEITIGLEIHCELKTQTKLFCSCKNEFGSAPNANTCEICMAYPGTLPVMNEKAVESIVKAGIAMNCEIAKFSKWDRKNYFYPDLPKAWQNSQYDLPIVGKGVVEYELNGQKKQVRINRIHLEEDAGKLIHENGVTKVDYNRGGVPLMEIVTEPDLHSADEVVAFLTELRSIIVYTGVSEAKMQEGTLRCDVNLSLSKAGSGKLGTRTETKNLNSFSSARRSIIWETNRQREILESGGAVVQETRRWDDNKNEGYSMRSKENANDYMYFPDPDLLPVVMTNEDIAKIKATIPELKKAKKERYTSVLGLPAYDAEILTADKHVADLFDGTVKLFNNPKKVSNYIMSEIMRKGKTDGEGDITVGVSAQQLAALLKLVEDNVVSLAATKDVLDKIWLSDVGPEKAVDELNLRQNNDTCEIEAAVKAVIEANPKVVAEFRGGNEKTMAFFVGQVMKATKGKSNPKVVNEILINLLKG